MALSFRALTHWPPGRPRRAEGAQLPAPFRATYTTTAKELERELYYIGAMNAVAQLDVESASEFLRDGSGPRIDARMRSSAVVVTFQKQIQLGEHWRDVPVTFACDRFAEWRDNIRAIALGMESLRRVERYGITSAGEQYRGFAALPSSTTPAITTEQAAEIIRKRAAAADATAESIAARADVAKEHVRSARSRAHPDAGGSGEDFNLVQEAARVLSAHHMVSL